MAKKMKLALAAGSAIVLALAVWAILGSKKRSQAEEQSSDPTALIPASQLLLARPRPGSAPLSEKDPEIDLLNTIQLPQDAVAGDWGFQDRALITPSILWGRLQLPCIPPEEYDLKLRVTRKRGAGSMPLGIVMGGIQGTLILDGEDGTLSWLARLGAPTAEGNDTARSARLFRWNKPASLQVSVRKDGITVVSDGKEILRWKGTPNEFAVPPGFVVPNGKCLVLGSSDTIFRIDEFMLIPITGTPTLLRKV